MHIDGQISYRTALLTAFDALSVRALEFRDRDSQKHNSKTGLPFVSPVEIPRDEEIHDALRDNNLDLLAHWIARLAWADEMTVREMAQQALVEAFPQNIPIDMLAIQ